MRVLTLELVSRGCSQHITREEQLPREQWDKRAAALHAEGKKQRQCAGCGIWFWPFEWKVRPLIRGDAVDAVRAALAPTADASVPPVWEAK